MQADRGALLAAGQRELGGLGLHRDAHGRSGYSPVVFRRGLLEGEPVAVLDRGELGEAAADACQALGARTARLGRALDPLDEVAVAAAVEVAVRDHGGLGTLAIDAAGLYADPPGQGLDPLRAATDGAWIAIRAAGAAAMIEAGGKLVLIAPPPGAGPQAGAARAALENLARTLSIEWARHQVRITAIRPGPATAPAEVGALVAYVASPAGDYFSGCRFTLGAA